MSSVIPVHKNPFEILDSCDAPTTTTSRHRRRRAKNKASADVKVTRFEVNLHLPFQDLLSQMTTDFDQKLSSMRVELEEKIDIKLAAHLEKQEKWVRVLHRGQGIRNIEDWAIGRMKRELKMPKKTKRSYAQIITQFISEFDFSTVKKSDLQSLKSSQGRTDANSVFHISLFHSSDEDINELWKLIKPSLSEEEEGKYERLMQFGRGKTAIQKKLSN